MNTVGEEIKSKRISKKLSISDISNELKISIYILENIENDKFTKEISSVFYIGHIRSYANFLDLNPNEIINRYKKQNLINPNDILTIQKPDFKPNFFNFQKYVSFALVIIIFSSFYFFFIKENNKTVEYALTPDIPEMYIPIIENADMDNPKFITNKDNISEKIIDESFNFSSAIASNKNSKIDNEVNITLKILNPTWLQLRDESNNIIISQLMKKGEEYSYEMKLGYNITAGNAGNILVVINNDVRGKIGKYGEVVDSIKLDNNFKN